MKSVFLFDHLWRALLPWAIILVFVAQLVFALANLSPMLAPLVNSPKRSYEEKMRVQWGSYFDLVHFVQDETPENAVILLSPKRTGNVEIYFLFPRTLYYGGEETFRLHPDIEYVVIDGGYPNFVVEGEMIVLDSQRGLYRIKR